MGMTRLSRRSRRYSVGQPHPNRARRLRVRTPAWSYMDSMGLLTC